jgi:hypothetical protein
MIPTRQRTEMRATHLRQHIYRNFIREGRAPTVAEMAKGPSCSRQQAKAGLQRLSQRHAFVLQENGELWRTAPFSACPRPFPSGGRRE